MGAEVSAEIVVTDPLYAWSVEVRRWNHYGDRVQSRTPAVIHASTKAEVSAKVRAAFGATYDSGRKFWSHDWVLNDMREISTPPAKPTQDTP